MTPGDREADTLLSPIRAFQQQGDIRAAQNALNDLLDHPMWSHPAVRSIHAVILILSGQIQEGKIIIQAISDVPPRNGAWASDLGFGLFLLGDHDAALTCFESTRHLPDTDAVFFNRMGSIALASGRLETAVHAFKNALASAPEKAEIHSNLGGAMVRLGRLLDALSHYNTALFLNPDLTQAKHGKTAVLLELDQADVAILDLERELEETADPQAKKQKTIYLAGLLHAAGRFEEALNHLRTLIKGNGDDTSLHLGLAALLLDRSCHGQAISVLKTAEKASPDNPDLISMLAKSYGEAGLTDQAHMCVDRLVALAPQAPGTFLSRAHVNFLKDKNEETERDLRHVTDHFPHIAEAWGLLGHHLMVAGRLEESVSAFETASKLNPAAFANLIEARAFPNDPRLIEKLTGFAENPLNHPESRTAMDFALCKFFENMGEYDRAFHFAQMGNRLAMRTHPYDADRYDQLASIIKETVTKSLLRRFRGHGSPSIRPIFIVGMPRSGTTLVEQMLASHPEVAGLGELGLIPAVTHLMPRVIRTQTPYPACMELFDPWMADHAARYYLKKIDAIDAAAPRVTDKLPHNFLHLGLISLMFPKASIIHVNRDMRDVTISNYFTNYKYKDGIMGFAFDLTTIDRMIHIHDDLMAHYASIMERPFFRLSYEALVEDPETVMKELCAYLDLSWDEGILKFHLTRRSVKTASVWQVRQPLYQTSRKRWKNYKAHLAFSR